MSKVNRRKFITAAVGGVIVAAAGTLLTEYYLAPKSISRRLSELVCRQGEEQALILSQKITPQIIAKTYFVKGDVTNFSEEDSDSLTVIIQLETISNIQLENVKLRHFGLKGFQFSNALMGSPETPEEKYSTVSPSSESRDKIEFTLPDFPYGKKTILKLFYTPQPDAEDSHLITEGTAQYYDEGWSVLQRPLDFCAGYRDVNSSVMTSVKIKDVKLQLVDVELQLFHDYHGDGAKQEDEPIITDMVLNLLDEKSEKTLIGVTANNDGIYRLENLKENHSYKLEFKDEEKKYRHISISNKEFYTIDSFQFIADSNKKRIELGLMNGYLTLPFESGGPRKPSMYFDRGKGKGWRGYPSYKTHNGTDFMAPKGTPILASAPGIVTDIGYIHQPGNYVVVTHDNGTNAHYCHLDKQLVNQGQKVNRGQIIGTNGNTGVSGGIYHLHLINSRGGGAASWYAEFDPYDDSYSAWTKANDPQYPIPDE